MNVFGLKKSNNNNFVYKSLNDNYIITLLVLPDTKFSKIYVKNKCIEKYTEQLINKAQIVKIEHKLTKESKNSLNKFYYQSKLGIIYNEPISIGQILNSPNYDEKKIYNSDHQIDGGITVYKSYEGAFYSEIPTNYNGKWYVFRKLNGILKCIYNLTDGKRNGKAILYGNDGVTIEMETNYVNNYEIGDRLTYFGNKLIKFETIYKGKREGLVIYFTYPSGEIMIKCIYHNDKCIEKYI